jgi:hypothetical protein
VRVVARLGAMQARANGRMLDTCRVTKPGTSDRGALNPTTGQYDSTPAVVMVYEGSCRMGRIEIPHAAASTSGEATWQVQDSVLHLPLDGTTGIAAGQTVTYLTSDANPALEGRSFGIIAVVVGTQLTARRCIVREVVS